MYFASDFWALFCFIVVWIVVYIIFFKAMCAFGKFFVDTVIGEWLFRLLVSEQMIRIHEAGHMVAYLRTLDNCKTSKYRRKVTKIENMHQARCSGMVTIVTNEWNKRRMLLLLGGCAATLKAKGKTLTRLGYTFQYYLAGCGSDFWKLRCHYHMSKKTVIWMVNSMILSLTDRDMDFIRHIADVLGRKETAKNKYNVFAKSFDKDELFQLAEEYRLHYRENPNN